MNSTATATANGHRLIDAAQREKLRAFEVRERASYQALEEQLASERHRIEQSSTLTQVSLSSLRCGDLQSIDDCIHAGRGFEIIHVDPYDGAATPLAVLLPLAMYEELVAARLKIADLVATTAKR